MTSHAAAVPMAHAHHDDRSFIRKYIFSTDHKIIGIQFLLMSLLFLLVGGVLAMIIRWQQGYPGEAMPGGRLLPESMAADGVVLPEFYNAMVTMHGTFMVFFAIMPLLVGVYANFLIPLKLGAHDMAFPRINMWSFWLALLAGLIMLAGFFVPEGAPRAGWTMYAPLSARPDLSGEAIRLGRVLCELMPSEPENGGLLALMLLHHSRHAARVSAEGKLVTLDQQDRSRWDQAGISEGCAILERALRSLFAVAEQYPELQASIEVGAEILPHAGLYGHVRELRDLRRGRVLVGG